MKKNIHVTLFIFALSVILIRGLELRLPLLSENFNEDEYHHNYWILATDSLQEGLIVQQQQPLLDYFLRKHFWFPVLNNGSSAILGLGAILLFSVFASVYLRQPTDEGTQEAIKSRKLLIVWASLSLFEISVGIVLMLQQSLSSGILFQSFLHVARILIGLVFFAGFVWVFLMTWWEKPLIYRFSNSRPPTVALISVLLSLSLLAAGTLSLLLAPIYFSESLAPAILVGLKIVYPLAILVYLILMQSALLLLGLRLGKLRNLFLTIGSGVYLFTLLLIYSQGGVQTLDYELILRIPSITYGTLLLVLTFMLAYQVFYGRTRSPLIAIGLAFVIGLWIVYHPDNQFSAANGRHYILVSLASVWWSYAFIIQADKVQPLQFDLLSIFVANTHFFALPLLIAAYGWETLSALREKSLLRVGFTLFRLSLVAGVTFILNWRPLEIILSTPPGHSEAAANPLLEGLSLWWGGLQYLLVLPNFPDYALLNAIAVLIFLFILLPKLFADQRIQRLYFLLLIVLPSIFIYIRWRSSFGFIDRYYSVFLGLGFVLLLLTFDVLYQYVIQLPKKNTSRSFRQIFAFAMGGAFFLLVFPIANTTLRIIPEINNLYGVPPNFSDNYELYNDLKNYTPVMMLLHSELIWYDDAPGLYLEFLAQGFPPGSYEMMNSGYPPAGAKQRIETFLAERQNGKIVLNWHEANCTDQSAPTTGLSEQIIFVGTNGQCVWVIEGISSFEEVSDIAHSLGFLPQDGKAYCFDLNCE